MATAFLDDVFVPTSYDSEVAQRSSKTLAPYVTRDISVQITGSDDVLNLPKSVVHLLITVLSHMAEGNAVTLMPVHAELTTQQAAELLGVSRPFLIGLLEKREIPHHMVGTHRRVFFQDLKRYMERIREERSHALDELATLGQELDEGY